MIEFITLLQPFFGFLGVLGGIITLVWVVWPNDKLKARPFWWWFFTVDQALLIGLSICAMAVGPEFFILIAFKRILLGYFLFVWHFRLMQARHGDT